MGRNSSPSPDNTFEGNGNASAGAGANDLGFRSIRDRLRFKRNPNPSHNGDRAKSLADRAPPMRGRSHYNGRFNRRGFLSPFLFKGKSAFYLVIISAVFLFALASMVLQSSITSVFKQGSDKGRLLRDGLRFGTTLRFVPGRISRRLVEANGLDRLRNEPRFAVRMPRLALVSVLYFYVFFLFFIIWIKYLD